MKSVSVIITKRIVFKIHFCNVCNDCLVIILAAESTKHQAGQSQNGGKKQSSKTSREMGIPKPGCFKPGCLQYLRRNCFFFAFFALFCAHLRTCVCAHLRVSASDCV